MRTVQLARTDWRAQLARIGESLCPSSPFLVVDADRARDVQAGEFTPGTPEHRALIAQALAWVAFEAEAVR